MFQYCYYYYSYYYYYYFSISLTYMYANAGEESSIRLETSSCLGHWRECTRTLMGVGYGVGAQDSLHK